MKQTLTYFALEATIHFKVGKEDFIGYGVASSYLGKLSSTKQ